MSESWSSSNELKPWQVASSSNKAQEFKCKDCKHTFSCVIQSIKNDKYCPYCCHHPKLCGEKSCKFCYEKSFAATPRGQYWSSKNELDAWEVAKNANKKFLMDCPDCETCFPSRPNDITSKGNWCPKCKNKTEKMLINHLDDECEEDVTQQATLKGCGGEKRLYPFDCMIKTLKLIIELDGRQHFEKVSRFKNNVEDARQRDLYKTNFAISKGLHCYPAPPDGRL
jgi:hypothetical protein